MILKCFLLSTYRSITMGKRFFIIYIILILTLFLPSLGFSQDVEFYTHSLNGQVDIDNENRLIGKPHGGKRAFTVELIKAMMLSVGQSLDIKVVPFKRGLHLLAVKDNVAFFNISRIPARELSYQWVGPLQLEVDYFFEMKKNPTGIKSMEDAKNTNHKICVLNGNVHETVLTQQGFTNLRANVSYLGCLEMLKLGRVDLTPLGTNEMSSRLKKTSIHSDAIQRTPVVVLKSEGFIAFSKKTSPQTINLWQRALDELKKSGKYEILKKQYN